MTEAELNQILERLQRLENEVKQLAEAVKPLTAAAGESKAVREPAAPYAAEEKRIIQTAHPHIVRIPEVQGGTPLIRGPYKTVWAVVELFQRGMSAEQIVQAFWEEQEVKLTLAQVHSALSFYFDNKEEIDKTLAEKLAEREEWVQRYLKLKFGPKDPDAAPPPPLPATEPKPVIETDHPYIIRIPGKLGGEPIVRDPHFTVRGIVALMQQGMTPQQIVVEHDGDLTPAQVYDALSYYYDHQAELEAIFAGHAATGDEMRRISYQQQVEYAKRKREENVR